MPFIVMNHDNGKTLSCTLNILVETNTNIPIVEVCGYGIFGHPT